MMNPKIEEIIQRDGQILETTHGISMEPMLKQGRNPIVISKVTAPIRKRDVILFRDRSGKYILHRVIKVSENGFVTRGDNLLVVEKVAKDGALGILTGYYKGEKYIDCHKNFGYRVYSFFIPLQYYAKRFVRKVGPFVPKPIKRLIRKIFK